MQNLTHEQEVIILKSNGWQTLWHPDAWIRTEWIKNKTALEWKVITQKEALQQVLGST
jgi:hypothetical protein